MQVEKLEIESSEARAKLEAYRLAKQKDLYGEVREQKKVYEEAVKGKPLIDLHQSMRSAGWGEDVILWEAEWEPEPPRDPMLLERIVGPIYAVLAAWDLTDLERAVMRHCRMGGE